jgi:hypothetical protein
MLTTSFKNTILGLILLVLAIAAERMGPNSDVVPLCLTRPGQQWLGLFSVHGSDQQIFDADKQVSGRGQND